jgi:hypothetical protein
VEAVSVPKNLPALEIDDRLSWGQNMCILFDGNAPIFSTYADEIN